MTTYLLAGGGTAGHVNPLLAVADKIRDREPAARILVLGTAEGLESRLVPARGYELLTVPKVAFPRRPGTELFRFLPRLKSAVKQAGDYFTQHRVDIVVGFGGFASAPAYLAAKRYRIPLVIHEQNIRPGLANRLGARYTKHIGVSFAETRLPGALHVGTPLRPALETFDRAALMGEAREFFDLPEDRTTLLITGGSQGALHLNQVIEQRLEALIAAGVQIIHLIGGKNEPSDIESPYYRPMKYLDRMELALALADLAISRSGATTVSEFAAIGLPAIFVPLPHGNGEQRLNAQGMVSSGGAMIVENQAFTPEWIDQNLLPLLQDASALERLRASASTTGIRDGADRMVNLIQQALQE